MLTTWYQSVTATTVTMEPAEAYQGKFDAPVSSIDEDNFWIQMNFWIQVTLFQSLKFYFPFFSIAKAANANETESNQYARRQK